MDQTSTTRRNFLLTIAGTAAAASLFKLGDVQAAEAALPHLLPSDPTASSLHYVEDVATLKPAAEPSLKPGSRCGNCAQYQGGASEWGGCLIFAGKDVHSKGWCRAYSPKT